MCTHASSTQTLLRRSEDHTWGFFFLLTLSLTGRNSSSRVYFNGTPGSGNRFADSPYSAVTFFYMPYAPTLARPSPLPGQVDTPAMTEALRLQGDDSIARTCRNTRDSFSSLLTSSPLSSPSPQKTSLWCKDQSRVTARLLSDSFSNKQTV